MRSVHQSLVSQLPGRDHVDVHDTPGSGLWKMTYDLPTLVYTLHGVEHTTDLTGEYLLGQLGSGRGMHAIDDDDIIVNMSCRAGNGLDRSCREHYSMDHKQGHQ